MKIFNFPGEIAGISGGLPGGLGLNPPSQLPSSFGIFEIHKVSNGWELKKLGTLSATPPPLLGRNFLPGNSRFKFSIGGKNLKFIKGIIHM